MGLACLVFPGANHTRFEHSLGTLFVANRLVQAIIRKTEDRFVEDNLGAIRVAALLHDLGHSPFSHVTEEFFRRNPDYLPTNGESYDHEIYTQKIIQRNAMLRKILRKKKLRIRFVSELATGKSGTFLDSLLSGSIDVDKMDYVARDSYFCGLPYGRIDLSSLAEGVTIAEDSLGREAIAFDRRSRDAVEGLLMSRFYLASTIHVHERTCAANQLLFRALANAYNLILEFAEKPGLTEDVKTLVLDCLHFRWVDHDLITFLADPLQKIRLAARKAKWEEFSSLKNDTLREILDKIPSRPIKRVRRYFSSIMLTRVLKGESPALRLRVPLFQLSPLTRYSLYVLHKLSPYTNHLNNFKRFVQKHRQIGGKKIFIDITTPKLSVMDAKIMWEKKKMKYLFDISSIMRSLVSEATNRLTLAIYSYVKIGRMPIGTLSSLIRLFARRARKTAIRRGIYLGSDLILLVYYYLQQFQEKKKLFFEGDTRFQAFFAVMYKGLLKGKQKPYEELAELSERYPDLNTEDVYEAFREEAYPDFFSVGFSQDLELLTEMGLIYSRSGPVKILGIEYYPKRYERRISRYGRGYVKRYLVNNYPFSRRLRQNIRRAFRTENILIKLGE